VAARSKAWVCGHSLAGIVGSNSAGGMDVCLSLVSVVRCQVEVSALGWSLVQRSPNECGVSECDCESSIIRRPWPTGGCCAMVLKRSLPGNILFTESPKCSARLWVYIRICYTVIPRLTSDPANEFFG